MKKKRECYLLRFMVIIYVAIVFTMTLGTGIVCAASDPLAVINNLSTFIFSLIRAIGLILLGFGIVQIGLSLKSHDPSQRANVFMIFLDKSVKK